MSKRLRARWFAPVCCALLLATFGCEKETPKGKAGENASAQTSKATATGTTPDENGAKGTTPKPRAASNVTPIFDLVANRHLAHFADGGILLDMGIGAGLKYVQGRWKNPWFDASQGESKDFSFAYPKGIGATLRFPLGSPEQKGQKTDKSWKLQARLKPVGDQRCDVFINAPGRKEEKFASLVLEDGWKTYTMELPAGLELGQEHTVRFHFSRSRDVAGLGKSAAGFDWVRAGKDLDDKAPARQLSRFDVAGKKITLEKGQRLTWFTTLAPSSLLHIDKLEGKVELHISTDTGGDSKKVTLEPGDNIDQKLSDWDNKPVALTISAPEGKAVLNAPSLALDKQEPAARGEDPQYVVVWLIDTLRADHLPSYNPATDVEAPQLTDFAKKAALFKRASVQGNSSLPSSASIFSGAYPPKHQLVRDSAELPKDFTVLGEGMKKAGWINGLFSSNGYVSTKRGFARGFSKEVNPIQDEKPSETEHLWPAAKSWLAEQVKADAKKKVFVYINTSDPHVPYDPPADDLKKYHSGGQVGRVSPRATGELLHDLAKPGAPSLNGAEQAYMRALYKGEITYNDRWFGKMLEDLKAMGILDKTMIIVTSDHGEEFGEYGRYGHGISVNQELIDVPLIIGYKPWTENGVVVEHAAEALDIYPTLLDIAGVASKDFAANIQGRSLVPAILAPTRSHPTTSIAYHNDFLRSARVGDLKYQLFQGDNDPLYEVSYHPTKYENYNQAKKIDDPDVSTAKPVARRQMRDLMAFHLRTDTEATKREDGQPNNHSAERAVEFDKGW